MLTWQWKHVFLMYSLAFLLLLGCAAEKGLQVGREDLGGTPVKHEELMMNIDARGFVNGEFQPTEFQAQPSSYPVSYSGDWSMRTSTSSEGWNTIQSAVPGAQVSVTATFSRLVFDFWDFELYQNPGVVRFELDGQSLGSHALAKRDAAGNKVLDYVITADPKKASQVTMTLESGRVVIFGYLLVYE
jgi:hypothetical protein